MILRRVMRFSANLNRPTVCAPEARWGAVMRGMRNEGNRYRNVKRNTLKINEVSVAFQYGLFGLNF